MKMKMIDSKKMGEYCVNLEGIGGREVSVQDLVNEVISNRRRRFWENLFSMRDGEITGRHLFDGLTFNAATDEFAEYVHENEENYEGIIEYEVTAGNDWVWKCKTQISWHSTLPVAFGELRYKTEMTPNGCVQPTRIHAMSGVYMEIRVITNALRSLSMHEALQRDKRNLGW